MAVWSKLFAHWNLKWGPVAAGAGGVGLAGPAAAGAEQTDTRAAAAGGVAGGCLLAAGRLQFSWQDHVADAELQAVLAGLPPARWP